MALDKVRLKTAIKDEFESVMGQVADDPAQLDKFAEAIATAVIVEINTNAEVVVGGGSSAGTYSVD